MWEMASLFEHVGTAQDGMATLTKPSSVVDAPGATELTVPRGEVRFEALNFHYPNGKTVIEGLDSHIRPGEKIGLVGRSGAGRMLVNPLLRPYDIPAGRWQRRPHPDRRPGHRHRHARLPAPPHRHGHAGHLALHRSVADNIRYGSPTRRTPIWPPPPRGAHAAEFIEGLSDP